ncbi:hypothetical protein AYJ57_08150 [Salipiger sp. CCB-MM3]|uniref:hypothetical protein n=1 Tax=Salipiger sp. CCB-MM3 TaxID=1792508 RepID=UPI00080AB268|nr:hypothetical protein [Salipiger sp. CCB-MM3]ANT60329.1 hypothetical protein AYJ57_08150 [Salipiger sp. CCB-MM3]
MDLIADILLVAGALGAGFYCFVLSRRLTRFTDLENGVGGAVAVLSAQVDDLTRSLDAAQKAAGTSGAELSDLTERGEQVAQRLELLIASMHDLPEGDVAASRGASAEPEAEPVFLRHSRSGAR